MCWLDMPLTLLQTHIPHQELYALVISPLLGLQDWDLGFRFLKPWVY